MGVRREREMASTAQDLSGTDDLDATDRATEIGAEMHVIAGHHVVALA